MGLRSSGGWNVRGGKGGACDRVWLTGGPHARPYCTLQVVVTRHRWSPRPPRTPQPPGGETKTNETTREKPPFAHQRPLGEQP